MHICMNLWIYIMVSMMYIHKYIYLDTSRAPRSQCPVCKSAIAIYSCKGSYKCCFESHKCVNPAHVTRDIITEFGCHDSECPRSAVGFKEVLRGHEKTLDHHQNAVIDLERIGCQQILYIYQRDSV